MRTPPRTQRLLVTLALTALTSLAATPAPAQAAPAQVRRIDVQLREAHKHIERWNRALLHWQTRVGRAVGRLQRVQAEPAIELPAGPDYLSPRWANRVIPRTPSLEARLAEAHRHLQSVLRDHGAREAQQQLQAWGAFELELEVARTSAVQRARHDGSVVVPNGPITYEAWARGFLGSLGAPTCDDNVVLVVTWQTAESTQAWFNPLATTHDMEGAGIFNSSGVRNYVSVDQGLQASRDTLEGGAESYGYGVILNALRACAPAKSTARAIRDSAWCRGCASGAYVIGLLPVVRAGWTEHATRLVSTPGA